jgi:hypothetical protein
MAKNRGTAELLLFQLTSLAPQMCMIEIKIRAPLPRPHCKGRGFSTRTDVRSAFTSCMISSDTTTLGTCGIESSFLSGAFRMNEPNY